MNPDHERIYGKLPKPKLTTEQDIDPSRLVVLVMPVKDQAVPLVPATKINCARCNELCWIAANSSGIDMVRKGAKPMCMYCCEIVLDKQRAKGGEVKGVTTATQLINIAKHWDNPKPEHN